MAPGSGLVRLPVPVHLLAWGTGEYMTEACGAAGACVEAAGGRQALSRDDSVSAIGYFKAPNVGAYDHFGLSVALSADGDTLAVGAPLDDSAATGTFVPGGTGYQAALDSDGASDSGAVTVYRRSGSAWRVEAFIKAPNADSYDWFGRALALSADGATLAVGAPWDGSASTGAFAPGDAGYQAALDSDGAPNSGAVTVYRRSVSAWRVEAFVKAHADAYDYFGDSLALSADGDTLAVGASASTGGFTPGDAGYYAALYSGDAYSSNSGTVTVYRRSVSAWRIEAFVKAPAHAGDDDSFGKSLSLSADGATLAVGALHEDSASVGALSPGYRAALGDDSASQAGAVYVYRRPPGPDAWTVGNLVKASNAGAHDYFSQAIALSEDGATLAVGAAGEDGGAQPQPLSGFHEEASVDVDGSGAVYLY